MSNNVKIVLRLAGLGLIVFGMLGNLPQGWALAMAGVGFLGLIVGGGGG